MKTKPIILILALLLTLSTATDAVTPRHRHQPQTEQPAATTARQPDGGIEAYSDTTAADTTYSHSAAGQNTGYYDDNYDDADDDYHFYSKFARTFGDGFIGGLSIFMVFLTAIIFIIAPVVIIALVLRYLIKRHNLRMEMMEKEMAAERAYEEQAHKEGRPYRRPCSSYAGGKPVTREALMQRGITQIAVGVGLAIMFFFFDWDYAIGIGLLVACIGAGKYYSAWRMEKHGEQPADKTDFEENDEDDRHNTNDSCHDMNEPTVQEEKQEENR